MKYIEKYIQFAIDNRFVIFGNFPVTGFELCNKVSPSKDVILRTEIDNFGDNIDIIRLITSKPFIEAIERGLEKTKDVFGVVVIDWDDMVEHYHFDHGDEEIYHGNDSENRKVLTHDIATQQAIAIRDVTLEQFINNILPKE